MRWWRAGSLAGLGPEAPARASRASKHEDVTVRDPIRHGLKDEHGRRLRSCTGLTACALSGAAYRPNLVPHYLMLTVALGFTAAASSASKPKSCLGVWAGLVPPDPTP